MVYESMLHGASENLEFLQISNLHCFPSHSTTDQGYPERFPAFQPEPAGSWRKWADHDSRWSLLFQQSEQGDRWCSKGTCYDKTTIHLRTTGKIKVSQTGHGWHYSDILWRLLLTCPDTRWEHTSIAGAYEAVVQCLSSYCPAPTNCFYCSLMLHTQIFQCFSVLCSVCRGGFFFQTVESQNHKSISTKRYKKCSHINCSHMIILIVLVLLNPIM